MKQTTMTDSNHHWVIYSQTEDYLKGDHGYWSAESASWGTREQATRFPTSAVGTYTLPTSALQNRQWMDLSLADLKDEITLSGALQRFCTDKGLPLLSADELLLSVIERDGSEHPNAIWLTQFIEQWEWAVAYQRGQPRL